MLAKTVETPVAVFPAVEFWDPDVLPVVDPLVEPVVVPPVVVLPVVDPLVEPVVVPLVEPVVVPPVEPVVAPLVEPVVVLPAEVPPVFNATDVPPPPLLHAARANIAADKSSLEIFGFCIDDPAPTNGHIHPFFQPGPIIARHAAGRHHDKRRGKEKRPGG